MPDANRRLTRLSAGLCGTCGRRKRKRRGTRCTQCAITEAERSAMRRELAAERGLCEACLKAPRVQGRGNRCDPCANKYLEAQRPRDRARRARRKQRAA